MTTLAAVLRRTTYSRAAGGRTLLVVAAALLLLVATQLPWWGMLMFAPQYPQGLEISAYLNDVVGDVSELEALNHYVGMMSLTEAAKIERMLVVFVVPAIIALTLLSLFVNGRWQSIMRLPMMLFPAFFMADLAFWLWYAGNHLNPAAPLSKTVPHFTPTLLGEGRIAQFVTYGFLQPGFWVALAAALCVLLAGLLARSEPPVPQEQQEPRAPEGSEARRRPMQPMVDRGRA